MKVQEVQISLARFSPQKTVPRDTVTSAEGVIATLQHSHITFPSHKDLENKHLFSDQFPMREKDELRDSYLQGI
jgi:hypothetical protein